LIEKNLLTITILEGIEESEGCPLCYLWVKSEKLHMEHLLTNEVVMNPEFREKVQSAKGFCNYHMHLLYNTARQGHTEDGFGYALYMQDVVERISKDLESLPSYMGSLEGSANSNVFARRRRRRNAYQLLSNKAENAVQGQQPCPACESLWSSDQIHLHTLVQMLDNDKFREEFKSSKGLCLPHFIMAVRMSGRLKLKNQAQVARALIEVEIKRLQLVEHYLSEFVRKQSWDFSDEPWGPEANANSIVLNLLVGAEGLYGKNNRALSRCKEAIDYEEIERRAEDESKVKLKRI